MILNGRLQLIKHTEGFVLKLDQRIALSNRTEVNAGTHDIQCVNVIHPQPIHDLQRVRTL